MAMAARWTCPGRAAKRESKDALERMEALCVIEPLGKRRAEEEDEADENGEEGGSEVAEGKLLKLTEEFHKGMQKSLTCLQSAPWPAIGSDQATQLKVEALKKEKAEGKPSKADKYPPPPTPDELETYTQRRWDSVLHFLVGSSPSDVEDPPAAVVHFLERTGLMQDDPDWRPRYGEKQAPLVITSRGYEFMLQDVHVQVWQFVLQYFKSLGSHRKRNEIRAEALLFLIGLSFCRVGRAYPAGALTKDARILMRDFSQFGLIYVCKIGTITAFYPTRVAIDLVVGSLAELSDRSGRESSASATRALEANLAAPVPGRSHLAVIVQTNFQLCAYTASELHVSMLGLFCDPTNFVRLPNVVFFRITRDAVKNAFKMGIEADQILRFLRMHAHPRLRTGDQSLIPSNVEDQILLWDRERSRVTLEEVYALQCKSHEEFRAVEQYAADAIGAYGWGAEDKNKLFVHYNKAERVVAFLRRWRSRQAQRQAEDNGSSGIGGSSDAVGRKKKRRHNSYA